MQLSPLQSRLAASVVASCLLLLLYLALFSPHFALAAEILEQTLPVPYSIDDLDPPLGLDGRSPFDPAYEPEFAAFDRSIVGRAPAGVTPLVNNNPMPMNVLAGTTQLFVFEKEDIFGRVPVGINSLTSLGREDEEDGTEEGGNVAERTDSERVAKRATKTIYISANTCQQPQAVNPNKTTTAPEQLVLYVSTSPDNQSPGPSGDKSTQTEIEFKEGAVMHNVTTSGDVFLGIHAPNNTEAFSGAYNFRVAVSSDGYFYSYDVSADADLIWVDSDSQGALLITHALTNSSDQAVIDAVMKTQPYVMFAQNQDDRSINGLRYSYCGLQNFAQIAATKDGKLTNMVSTGMTRREPGNMPKQQFYFSGLNASTEYFGILARSGSSGGTGPNVVGGGGVVFSATNFTTKSDHGNCQIIVDLPFCDQVAYSVPSNPTKFANATFLAKFYDDYAASMFENFKKVLQQIPCEAPPSQRYSLARNCSDCEAAYKSWLCSVTIPRCEDFSTTGNFLQPRNIKQAFPNGERLDDATIASFPDTAPYTSSRNSRIDEVVQPGPYKEVLPCDDLCYNLVQSCHAAMGFSCPTSRMLGYNTSYGRRKEDDKDGQVTCNYPGSAHIFSGSARVAIPWVLMSAGVGAMMFLLA